MSPINIEVPSFGRDHAISAASLGAHRLEINATSSYAAGGLTPSPLSFALIATTLSAAAPRILRARSATPPPIRIMIRPRGPATHSTSSSPSSGTSPPSITTCPPVDPTPADFHYSPTELEQMTDSLTVFQTADVMLPAESIGYVFGCLTASGTLDVPANTALVSAAMGAPCTLHRAIDSVFEAAYDAKGEAGVAAVVEDIIACGFSAVLTSGRPGRAVDNVDVLQAVADAARGRLEVIIGGGVRKANAPRIVQAIGSMNGVWLHSSCLGSNGKFDEAELNGLLELSA